VKRLSDALSSAGAVLLRQGKHLVYRLPNGRKFTAASSPSDVRAERNALSNLRHALDAVPEHKEGVRRVKARKPGAPTRVDRPLSTMGHALLKAGAVDAAQDARIDDLERVTLSLLRKVDKLQAEMAESAWLNNPSRCVRFGPWDVRLYRKPSGQAVER
jgi:hypothetical protein